MNETKFPTKELIVFLIFVIFICFSMGLSFDTIIGYCILVSIIYFFGASSAISHCQKKIDTINTEKNILNNKLNNAYEFLNQKEKLYDSFKEKISFGWKYLNELITDIKTVEYDFSERYLKTKKRPAIKEAKRIAELKKETKKYISELKLMQYKYEYLYSLYPDLEYYIEDLGEIHEDFEDIEELEENIDRARKYLTKDEYERLDTNERNQLALDNYIASKKSKLQIGLEYERYIGYLYELEGWDVTFFGINKKLEDMGRDLIAKRGKDVDIIQCKFWSKYKMIHENHICQLYGTTIQYKIENDKSYKITPVFITATKLSEVAKKFAKYLDIKIEEEKSMTDFPRIKCNINNGERIYHLPFDQQYDRVKINLKQNELYAWTVDEAVQKGFRRAKKYYFQKPA